MRLLQKLAGNMSVVTIEKNNEPEITIMTNTKVVPHRDSQPVDKELENKEVVLTLVERIPEKILKQTTLRKKKVSFKEDAEELGAYQESVG